MSQSRRADLLLLLMLFLSGLVSFGFFIFILDYAGQHPGSFLERIVWLAGNMGGEDSIIGQESYKRILRTGSFFLPLLILGGFSFLIYFKFLKGQISNPNVKAQFK